MQAASISLVFTLLSALVLIKIYVSNNHYVKNIRIRRFSCPYFAAFVLKENTDQKNPKYGHFLRSKWKRSCYKKHCLSFLIIARPYNFCSCKLPRKITTKNRADHGTAIESRTIIEAIMRKYYKLQLQLQFTILKLQ